MQNNKICKRHNRHDKTRIIKDRQNLTRSFVFCGPANPEESPIHNQEVLLEVFYFCLFTQLALGCSLGRVAEPLVNPLMRESGYLSVT